MFRSATLRLTGWYLLILMTLSIVFSLVIYQVATNELETRLERFQTNLQQGRGYTAPIGIIDLRLNEENEANSNISLGLLYVNLFILIAGGFGSYFLARHNLLPIEEAHEAQSRFTSDASHELRTPLAVMKTEMEVALRDKDATASDLRDVLSSNLEEVDKLSKLAQMLLNLSRLEHAKLQVEPMDLNRLAREVVKDFGPSADRIVITTKAKKVMIRGNETAISELIKVLIENALLYSPKDSQVKIRIRRASLHAKFQITNEGPGIAPDKLPYIFDRFYRADSSRTNGEQKGYGLGLALAKKIVELHHGEISVSSEPNANTTFTITIPTNNSFQAKIQN